MLVKVLDDANYSGRPPQGHRGGWTRSILDVKITILLVSAAADLLERSTE